jgi:hypothetical protein
LGNVTIRSSPLSTAHPTHSFRTSSIIHGTSALMAFESKGRVLSPEELNKLLFDAAVVFLKGYIGATVLTFQQLKGVKQEQLNRHFVSAARAANSVCMGITRSGKPCPIRSQITCSHCGIERFCSAECFQSCKKTPNDCRPAVALNPMVCDAPNCEVCAIFCLLSKQSLIRKRKRKTQKSLPPVPLFAKSPLLSGRVS